MEDLYCCTCLQQRIRADFSDKLVFSYGLFDSALPYGCKAVVQMPKSAGKDLNQFILVYQPSYLHGCFSQFIDEFVVKKVEDNDTGTASSTTSTEKDADQSSTSTIIRDRANPDYLLNNGHTEMPLADFGPEVPTFTHSSSFSCLRTLNAMAPIAEADMCSYEKFREIASNFLAGSLEDNILCSISDLIEGKPTGRDAVNFLSLVGIPSFPVNCLPVCLRHPNVAPVLGLLRCSGNISFVLPKTPYTLANILDYSPDALQSQWHIRFLFYQLLSALAYLHGLGVVHGGICPSNVMLTDSCWSWLQICDNLPLRSNFSSRYKSSRTIASSTIGCCVKDCQSQGLYADLKLSPSSDWQYELKRWWRGDLSNFEYLLILNKLAGRRWGDHTFHTVMPWVIDFNFKPDENSDVGWRNLSKSKWRLAKGDEQLDFTYSTSEIPHHVSDECLSELAVCSYKARRLPLSVLRLAVRSVYEPNEYPSTMQRLYQWTPDECIPEFYSDSQIFYSLHPGMTDLAVPSWAGSPEEFIKLHREALESEQVSRQIHHWIDITFGYKMSGQAAISAKNVMLPSTDPTTPQSVGRRQLFTQPHPIRQVAKSKTSYASSGSSIHKSQVNKVELGKATLEETAHLQEFEDVTTFSEHGRHLSSVYSYHTENISENTYWEDSTSSKESIFRPPPNGSINGFHPAVDVSYLLEYLELGDEGSTGYQEFMRWEENSSCSKIISEDVAQDIFSVGCILAELNLKRPLFDSTSLDNYMERGVFPEVLQKLPYHTKVLVEACIRKDWRRRPSAKSLLESPYFPNSVKSSYLFLAPLQLLATDGSRLHYAANFAKQGALKAMGTFSAEICAPYCLALVANTLSDTEAEWAYTLLKEFLKCLKPKAVKTLILPSIRKILQATDSSHLKVSLLQDSFVQDIWNSIGKQAYLEALHQLVISNLYVSPDKGSAAAASVLLIGSSEELGVAITVNQTILPLIQNFGKILCPDGIEVLVRIGGLFGENFIVKQIIPLLKSVVLSCTDHSKSNRTEPVHNCRDLALIDCLMTFDGLIAFLPREVVVKELTEEGKCLPVLVLMQANMEITVLQVAATTLIAVCDRIGPELTSVHVLPQLKELFDEVAFSLEPANGSGSFGRNAKLSKPKGDEPPIENRIDLVLLLYPSFASLLGIEKLRQCCATWLLLEQYLQRHHHWKWEYTGESSRSGVEYINSKRFIFSKSGTSEYNPTKLLLNGVGWSIPQSQGIRSAKNLVPHKRFSDLSQNPFDMPAATSNLLKHEPWSWFPSSATSWDGIWFHGRVGGLKDELPWKIRATVLYSIRAHHGALRSLAVCQDECTVYTAGVGPGFKGTVQKWNLSRTDCLSGYYGHEEVVNDICVLSSSGRVASCDGTIHVWNCQTGKLISVFSEPSTDSGHFSSPLPSSLKAISDPANMLSSNALSSGILSSAFDGSLYTSMHFSEYSEKIVVGTGNGSLRFIDAVQGQKLHMWSSESSESGFPSLVSAICSSGCDKSQAHGAAAGGSSWIAAGLSSGICKMLDTRNGNIIASWQAHDGYITKLAAPEDHMLVSSSLDRTLRIWDLRRNWPPSQHLVFRGHKDGVADFSVWGKDVISISRNKIGLASLSRTVDDDGQHKVTPRNLYGEEHGNKFVSALSSVKILPFSRLFLVGTEDGYLRVCC